MIKMGGRSLVFNGTNPDFLLKNPDFLLKNDDLIIKQGSGLAMLMAAAMATAASTQFPTPRRILRHAVRQQRSVQPPVTTQSAVAAPAAALAELWPKEVVRVWTRLVCGVSSGSTCSHP